MAVEKYVIVSTDTANKVIIDGPVLWDGVSPLAAGPGRMLITVDAARSGGYTRPATPATELNAVTLRERAGSALAANAAFLAIPSPGPTAGQTTAQVQRVTRECSALIRLMLELTDTTDGT